MKPTLLPPLVKINGKPLQLCAKLEVLPRSDQNYLIQFDERGGGGEEGGLERERSKLTEARVHSFARPTRREGTTTTHQHLQNIDTTVLGLFSGYKPKNISSILPQFTTPKNVQPMLHLHIHKVQMRIDGHTFFQVILYLTYLGCLKIFNILTQPQFLFSNPPSLVVCTKLSTSWG